MADVVMQELRRTYGAVIALDRVDVQIPSGELLALLGPSGCGKTTALRLVAGFERPTVGRVLIGGRDVTAVPASRRAVGMVFQAYSLFPTMTALRNVEFGLRVRRVAASERRRRARELLELVGLAEAADRYPHQLSGGMQQRVALARALAIEPRVLLLDEPLSALDAKVRVQLRDEIRRLQSELGITTIYVTHDQEEALSVSDRVAVMKEGRIEQIGPPATIYSEPETPFVAEFIGTVNRIEAVVADGNGTVGVGDRFFRLPAASGRRAGERVLVLVRPETVSVGDSLNGSSVRIEGALSTSTFLGATTRMRIATPLGELAADIRSAGSPLPAGSPMTIGFEPESARVLALEG
jgi:putative spermidine/putrescine transport system ATP-binding protein